MYGLRRVNDAVHWYMGELSARVVAESGRACDRFHLGKLILQGLRDAPDFILQIDGATGESETCGSVLERSVRCAEAFAAMGLKQGDVIVLMAPNHLNLCIPFYAALYLGVAIAPIDRTLGIKELERMFKIIEPKIVFCQTERAHDVRTAILNCNIKSGIITFDENAEIVDETISFKYFMNKYGGDTVVDDFKPADFDPEQTVCLLVSTSGTTGLPKQAVATHKNWAISGLYLWYMRLQSSKDIDQEHAYHLINTYKPTFLMISPTLLASLLKSNQRLCDWTCFQYMFVVGGAVSPELLKEIKEVAPKVFACHGYGMSEISGSGLISEHDSMIQSCGKPCGHLQYRLVEVETGKDVLEPCVQGELWLSGPSLVKGYYKNPEATKEAFTEDGWFKTGDMFYRDEHWNFFFVERIKMLLKYKNHQVSPAEIQEVIRGNPEVQDVAVTGIPDYECGDLPVACVVRRPGSNVTAQEIKDLVKENLTDSKQLRGGLVFLDALPTTPAGKVDYKKLKEIVITAKKE